MEKNMSMKQLPVKGVVSSASNHSASFTISESHNGTHQPVALDGASRMAQVSIGQMRNERKLEGDGKPLNTMAPDSAAWGFGKRAEDPVNHHFERNLERIHTAAERNEMTAYGQNKAKVFDQIEQIRTRQIDIFRRQMKLEVGLSMDENEEENENEIFVSDGFSEKFQEKFKKKEKALDSIRSLLENLATQVKEVNDCSTDIKMPLNPGFREDDDSQSAESNLGSSSSSARPPDSDWKLAG